MVLIMGWSCYRGGHQPGFHCTLLKFNTGLFISFDSGMYTVMFEHFMLIQVFVALAEQIL